MQVNPLPHLSLVSAVVQDVLTLFWKPFLLFSYTGQLLGRFAHCVQVISQTTCA